MEFKTEKVSSLLGHTEVRRIEKTQNDNPFTIIASPYGLTIKGVSSTLSSNSDLQKVAQMIGESWNDYNDLKPKIYTTKDGALN